MFFEFYQNKPPLSSGLLGLTSLAPAASVRSDWRWRLKGANGEPIASGEGYTSKENCLHAIDLLKGTDANTPVRLVYN